MEGSVTDKDTPAPTMTSFLKKLLRPNIYCNYVKMRNLVPHYFADIRHSPELEHDAYQHPAVTKDAPLPWVPRGPMGDCAQEVNHTNQVTPIDSVFITEKSKLVWD